MMTTSTPKNPEDPIGPLRILYAEDLRDLRVVARAMLTLLGHSLACYENGRLAWEQVRVGPDSFDLIITDHHMPEMNGLEFVRLLRTIPFKGRIVVFSSDVDPRTAREYRKLGVDAILSKPIEPPVLRQLIRKLFPAGD